MSVTAAEEPDLEQTRPNYKLAEMLIEIGEYERFYNNQVYKFNAYMHAAEAVENFPKRITSAEQMQQLSVGRGIGKLIREYIATGKITMLEMIRETKQDEVEYIKELTRVPGIGPLVAKSLISQGVKTIEQLKKNQHLLYHNQMIGLRYLNDLEKEIHREEIESIDKYIENQVESVDKRYHVTLCGSYRRGAEFSDSIDILLTHPIYVSSPKALENHELKNRASYIFQDQKKKSTKSVLHKVIQKLVHEHFIVDTLTEGERRYTGVCKLKGRRTHRKLVVNLVPFDQYWCGVLYLTGNDLFNKYMRKIAKENGFVLSQYGLRKVTPNGRVGKAVRINSEEDIFKHLGLDYVKPELREFKV